jgi:hypothetical protein
VGEDGELLKALSMKTRTQCELVRDRDAKGLASHLLFVYGQYEDAEGALRQIVNQVHALIPRWKFSQDRSVNAVARQCIEEARARKGAPAYKSGANGNSWIEEGTGLPIYIVHVPEEALGDVRLSMKSGDFAKIHVELAESHDFPGKLDLYGTQANCEKAVLRLREIARSHDPDWMPGGDANAIVSRQDDEERANAVPRDHGWDPRPSDKSLPGPNHHRTSSVGWASNQNAQRVRKDSARSLGPPATGWSSYQAPGWDTQDSDVGQHCILDFLA